ncbi:MAG: YdiU family protein [Saprospiraceae bacterium]|nr:YdiU family protein [Saprospiraceae bacterium]
MNFLLSDTFTKELPADPISDNFVRQVHNSCFSFVNPTPCSSPSVIHVSPDMIEKLSLSDTDVKSQLFTQLFSGNAVYPGTKPYAMCYGGHQFGSWAGQLGDGRAINLFETKVHDQRWALQLKGAGLTPYSRTADGLAVLRSSVREYLCSEAMYFLGVPTTRALSLMLTGDEVLRDMMYDGNAAYEKGAVVCRVAPSFIRFGNFQILAARGETENLKKLTDYTLRYFYPDLGTPSKETYIAFFKEIVKRTMEMIVHWQRIGFVHGVMNTDNMSILGLTIDYGPYGWLENYDPGWTPNTTDAQGKRYRFGNQPGIAAWNLFQLANALYPLIGEAAPLEKIINGIQEDYEKSYLDMMKGKLGLFHSFETEKLLVASLEDILYASETDMTMFFRLLSGFDPKDKAGFLHKWQESSYAFAFEKHIPAINEWLDNYSALLQAHPDPERKKKMDTVNPKYVLRNYMAQIAIDAADKGDYSFIEEFYLMLQKPYDNQPEYERWFAKRPDWAVNKVGCSMLSCSS